MNVYDPCRSFSTTLKVVRLFQGETLVSIWSPKLSPVGRVNMQMDNHPGVPVLYTWGSQVGIVLYIYLAPPTSAIVCGRVFNRSQPDLTVFSGYSSFPATPKSTPSQKNLAWVLYMCSGTGSSHWGAFHMHRKKLKQWNEGPVRGFKTLTSAMPMQCSTSWAIC